MTALAGHWSFNGRANIAACRQMLDAQREFGPEAPVIQEVGPIALGARQFSMLPEDREGGSTINLSGGSLLLAGDVRLDNRAELISELGYASSEANSLSDTGLLARAFHRWEEGALQRIVGDFAFAVWDGRRSRLLLARDFSGQRPLHYHRQSGFIAFASMPGGLHALREIPRAPDLRAMAQFLALVPEGDTGSYFEEIAKVPPGHLVTFTPDGTAVHRFWQPTLTPIRFPNDRDYEEAIQEKFDRAVGQRLRGQPQVASHLSAGLDSASVTATAARLLRASGGRVTAFTAVPRPNYQGQAPAGRFADEGPLASETAALHPNIDHVLMPSPLRLPIEDLQRHFRLYQRPILNLVNFVWLDGIKDEAARRGLRVLLTGARGNMSVSYHGLTLLGALAGSGRWLRLGREIAALRASRAPWRSLASQSLGPHLPRWLWQVVTASRRRSGLPNVVSMLAPEAGYRWGLAKNAAKSGVDPSYQPSHDRVARRLFSLTGVDYGNYNKGTLAGWGIDVRDPTSDRELVEFCLRVPDEQYLRLGTARWLAKRAMADRVPASVLHARGKGYQAADWHEVFAANRDRIADEVSRIATVAENREILDLDRMHGLLRDWPAGNWNRPEVIHDYRLALLRGIAAGSFVSYAVRNS